MKLLHPLAIPVEITPLVLSYLDYPELPVLRATHPWFYKIIPSTPYSHLRLLEAEWTNTTLTSARYHRKFGVLHDVRKHQTAHCQVPGLVIPNLAHGSGTCGQSLRHDQLAHGMDLV